MSEKVLNGLGDDKSIDGQAPTTTAPAPAGVSEDDQLNSSTSVGRSPSASSHEPKEFLAKVKTEQVEVGELGPVTKRSLATGDDNGTESDNQKKKKKKRRALSCVSCRKLKTRCDFELEHGKCHRCSKLRLECSLTKEYNIDPSLIRDLKNSSNSSSSSSNIVNSHEMRAIGDRLNVIESNIQGLNSKLDSIISLLGARRGSRMSFGSADGENLVNEDGGYLEQFTADNSLDKYTSEAPSNIIKLIDSRLFQRSNKYEPLKQACDEFFQFYFANENLCLQLAKSFLETSHFWIIPGGIKELNRKYVIEHPFITCVFVILAMCFDENYNYIQEQQLLYLLTTKLLGIALITDPLTDHDIEAILYLSLYNIARKPKQPQIDSWILSGNGIKHFITSMDFNAIKNRVLHLREFDNDDFYHLRIFNSLCACHFQASLLSGRPVLISKEYLNIHTLTLKYPRAAIGDAIKVSELDLDVKFQKILERSRQYFKNLIYRESEKSSFSLEFEELQDWKKKWHHLIKKDISGILLFAYDTCMVFINRRFISNVYEGVLNIPQAEKFLPLAFESACDHSFSILERLLKLPSSLIRGSPSSALLQIVYASLTLCDFLTVMDLEKKSMALNLISKIYWHLNHIGEKMNDATDTVGKIIKSIVETASKNEQQQQHEAHRKAVAESVTNLGKNPNDTVYDPAKAISEERKKSFTANSYSPRPGGGNHGSPAESTTSASSYSKLSNLYSGNLKALHLNSMVSPEDTPDNTLRKFVGTNATTLHDTHSHVAGDSKFNQTSPFDFDSIQIPDVSQFDTFEEFFNGIFSDFNGDFSNVTGARLETPKLTGIGGTSGIPKLKKLNNDKDTI